MQKTKIELKHLAFFARHGVLEEEARLGQRFYLDVTALLDADLDLTADSTDASVSYVDIFDLVKAIFEGTRFNLIESAADAIGRALLDRFDRIEEVTVKVKKPSVPVDCICDYFAAEVTRTR